MEKNVEKDEFAETLTAEISNKVRESLASMQADMDLQRNNILAQIRNKAEEETTLYIEQELAELKSNLVQSDSQTKWKVKRDLLERRTQLVNDLFAEVRRDLLAFTQGNAYTAWCLEQIQLAVTQAEFGKASLKVRIQDVALFEKLLAANGYLFDISTSDHITIGGFIMISENKRYELDCTFDSILYAQRDWFFANSQLVL